jgi:hypothetical protein
MILSAHAGWQQQEGGRLAQTTINLGSGGHAAALAGPRRHNARRAALLGQEGGGGCAAVLVGWGGGRVLVAVRDDGDSGCVVALLGQRHYRGSSGHGPAGMALPGQEGSGDGINYEAKDGR